MLNSFHQVIITLILIQYKNIRRKEIYYLIYEHGHKNHN